MMTNGSEGYGTSDIIVLEGLETARKCPDMHVGPTGERGFHHLVYEVVDNSVNEALVRYTGHTEVTILESGDLQVVDNG